MDFSFLCTFVPGSEKSTDGNFLPVELSFPGKVPELSLRGTFALVELSLLRSECSKNVRSMELSFPGTFAPILKTWGWHYSNLSVGVFWLW